MFKQVFLCCDDKLVLEKVKNKNKINLNCFRAEQRAVRHEQRELGRKDESEGNGSSESSGLSAPAPKRGERGARGMVTQGHSSERRVRGGME